MAFDVKVLFSPMFEKKLFQKSGLISIANREFEGDLSVGSVKVNDYDATVTVEDYNDTVGLGDPEALNGSTRTLLIDKEKSFNFRVSERSKLQDNNQISIWAENAADEVKSIVESDIYGIKDTAGVNVDDQNLVTLDKDNIVDWIEDLVVKLENKGVYGTKIMTVNPKIMSILRKAKLLDLTLDADNEKYGAKTVYSYGNDVKFIETSGMANSGVVDILMCSPEFLNLAIGIDKMELHKHDKFFGDIMRGLIIYGVGTFKTAKAEVLTITV